MSTGQLICDIDRGALLSALELVRAPYADEIFLQGMRDRSDMPIKAAFEALCDIDKLAKVMAFELQRRSFVYFDKGITGPRGHDLPAYDVRVVRGAIVVELWTAWGSGPMLVHRMYMPTARRVLARLLHAPITDVITALGVL